MKALYLIVYVTEMHNACKSIALCIMSSVVTSSDVMKTHHKTSGSTGKTSSDLSFEDHNAIDQKAADFENKETKCLKKQANK